MIVPLSFLQSTVLIIIVSIFFLYRYTKSSKIHRLGILPELLLNLHHLHDKLSEILERNKGSVLIRGAWLAQKDVLLTSDPANVHYIMSTNFLKYPKGEDWRKRFDIFGNDGIFNSDFEEWKQHRKVARALFSHQKFQQHVAKIIPEITEKRLMPVLEHVAKQDELVDLQDLLNRHTFDFACMITTGNNPNFLSIGLPEIPFLKAIEDACEAIFFRHLVPESLWKLQSWLGTGKERKLSEGWKIIDRFWEEQISTKQAKKIETKEEDEEGFNLLDCYLTGNEVAGPKPSENIIRDNTIGLILAAEGTSSITLSWFFWILSNNPFIEAKIREELRANLPQSKSKSAQIFHLDDLNKLVYLHAALCETLRLYPPIPFQMRACQQSDDILPSGHQINQKTNVLISMYAMGRMASIWGEDCQEFKPERWITEGGIKHEPAHKFFAFNAGPRLCLGKDIAFDLMKIIAANIIHNYDVQVMEKETVCPNNISISFHIKHGLLVRIKNKKARI
ncbi:Cytochrome P450-like protein [Melia azedarach]|uniref:Cytochrome P450-like protein n=1 Tax=Melia azedarach TaxID=155640 RepID=A0ACC1XXG2_MELAZ|nr:Cytochrome P450-like protein [Melia azedarach]